MTLYLNGFLGNGMSLTGDKKIIQLLEEMSLSAIVVDEDLNPKVGETVEFLQYNPLLFYYEGRGGFEVDSWSGFDYRANMESNDTGTSITGLNSMYSLWTNVNGYDSSEFDFNGDVVIDFDIVTCTDNNSGILQIYDNDTNHTYFHKNLYSDIGARNGSHITVTMTNGLVEVYVDGVKNDNCTVQTNFTNPYRIGFRGYQNWSFKFKNFIIGGY